MLKTVEYKECTCDICGAKEAFPKECDMPKGWGWFRICLNRLIVDYHTCVDCGEKVKTMFNDMRRGGNK